jgi:DNA-binding Lrp family transcriptional regulator
LDALIFYELAQNRRKVARGVGRAKDACDDRSLPISVEAIAARVRALVEAGTIEGVGVSMWRHSEVRLRPPRSET